MKNIFIFLLLFTSIKTYSQNCTVNAGLDITTCPGSSVILEGNIGGNFVNNTLIWSQVSGPNTATFSNFTSLSPTVSGLIAGTYVFRITATCQIGGNASDLVNVTVLAGATGVTPSNIILTCYTPGSTINLTGTAPSGHTLTWSVASNTAPSAGTFNGSTSTSFTGNNPTIQFAAPPLSWCSDNSFGSTAVISVKSTNNATGCYVTNTFSVYYTFKPSAITAIADPAQVCGTCVNLTGSCQQNGTGTWSVVSSPSGAPAVTFYPNNTSSNTQVCNLIPGNYTFRWTVSGASCTNGTANVNVSVSPPTTITAPIANSKRFCPGTLPSIVSLEGNVQNPGETVLWSQVSGPTVTINNPTSPYAQAIVLTEAGAPYIFKYTILKGGCSLSDTMMISVNKSIAYQPASYGYCNFGAQSQFLSGLGTIPFMHADSIPVSLIYETGPAANMQVYFEARMYNQDGTATNIYYYSPAININTGGTASYTFKASTLWPTYNNLSASITAWIYTNNNIAGCSNILPGTYRFRSKVKDDCATYTSQPYTFDMSSVVGYNAGSDQMMPCGTTNTTLAGNNVRCEVTPFWTTVTKPSGAPDPITVANMYNTNAVLNTLQNGTYIFKWSSNAASYGCNINSDSVRITVASAIPAVPAVSGAGTYCRNTPINVTGALNSDASSGVWTVSTIPLGGAYTISPSTSSPNIIFTPTTASTIYTLTWTVTNGCGSRNNSLNIITNASTVVIPDVTTADNCWSSLGMSFGTLNATPAGGTWSSANPNYTLTTPNSTSTTVNQSYSTSLGSAKFYYTTTGACGTLKDSVVFGEYLLPTLPNNKFCSIATFPTTQTIALQSISPYANYQIIGVSGPGSPTVSPMNFTPTTTTQNLTLNASQAGQYSINIRVGSGTCFNTTTITVELSAPAQLAIAGPDINLCGNTNSIALNAQPNPLGTGFGLWSVQTVNNGFAPTFSNINSPTSTVTFNNGGGDVLLKWEVRGNNVNCTASNSDYLRIKYVPSANAGRDDFTCYDASGSPASIVLNGNNYTAGVGTWTILSQPSGSNASFINAAMPNTTITNMINGVYDLRWTITDPTSTCPVTTDDVKILVYVGCSIVPLELQNFTANWNNNDAKLFWEIKNETAGSKYILERATNPTGPFTSIAWFDFNNQNNGKYNYLDKNVDRIVSKNIYYRIKMLNTANEVVYSKIVTLKNIMNETLLVYPSIVNKGEKINILFNSNNIESYDWKLINMNGQIMDKKDKQFSGTSQISTDKISAGTYLLHLNSKAKTYIQKIVVN